MALMIAATDIKRTSKLNFSTFTEVLRSRALHQPNRQIYSFLIDGETDEVTTSYAELDEKARAIATQLQMMKLQGERALLLHPPGLEYIAAFFGCLYAGVIAVPAYPLRSPRTLPRIMSIINDASPAAVITTDLLLPTLKGLLEEVAPIRSLSWISTTHLELSLADEWREPAIDEDAIAFLQYTSGATSDPRGVMLSHANLLHNSALIRDAFRIIPESRGVSWLPPYHDMGLIGQILMPLYAGAWMALMSPAAFLQRPFRWMRAISAYQATHAGGPNFAYDLCVQKIKPEQLDTLDLSHWQVAFNGAEPIRHETLMSFSETFARSGFRREAFYPCYGLAEATLMVSCIPHDTLPVSKTVDASAIENHVVATPAKDKPCRTLVSSGKPLPTHEVVIVNPETRVRLRPNEIGEIWLSGPSVATGYWRRPAETEKTFDAYLSPTGHGPFLRTSDLGFMLDGELFVTGRLKDLIIILGRNLYPQDIELTVERAASCFRPGCGAAFSVSVGSEEHLVVAYEVEFRQQPNVGELIKTVRRAVADEHDVHLNTLVLLKPGSVPKTSSGKIQRGLCRLRYLDGTLQLWEESIGKVSKHI